MGGTSGDGKGGKMTSLDHYLIMEVINSMGGSSIALLS